MQHDSLTSSFTFPKERILMGPGPSNLSPQTLQALSWPIIGHLDPQFITLMEEIKTLLRLTFRTKNNMTFPLSSPASLAMEMGLVNLLKRGEKIVIACNGVFGKRLSDMAKRLGQEVVEVPFPMGKPVDPILMDETLQEHQDAKALFFVHGETSTGVISDAEKIASVAKKHKVLTLMDCVTTLGGAPVEIDKWGIDFAYSGTQKCLSCVPGLAPVTFSEHAMEVIRKRSNPVASWFLDVCQLEKYWGSQSRVYHHTAPINPLFSLKVALESLHREGLEKSWHKHQEIATTLYEKLEEIGLELMVSSEDRLAPLTTVKLPGSIDNAVLRKNLLENYNLEVGGGLGVWKGKVLRIGTMGHSCTYNNVQLVTDTLGRELAKLTT